MIGEATPEPANRAGPLSFAQSRLWFLDRLEPGTSLYNVPLGFRLRGRLDAPALAAALLWVVGRHQPLRTVFREMAEGPEQVLVPAPAELPVLDLSALPPHLREPEMTRLLLRESARPFNLEDRPPWRTWLLRISADEHLWFLNLHHILVDAWSLRLLLEEVSLAYRLTVGAGRSPLPPPPPRGYLDYARWQRGPEAEALMRRDLEFWQRRLADAPRLAELPLARPRPAEQSSRGDRCVRAIPASLVRGLRALSQELRSSLYMLLLAAFKAVLVRTTGSTDLVVATAVAERPFRDTESLVGLFLNTVVLRTDLSADPPFRDAVSRVRHTVLEALDHLVAPFERLVETLGVERDLSRDPLVQIYFAVQPEPGGSLDLPGVRSEALIVPDKRAKFDLALTFYERGEGLNLHAIYRADLYDAVVVERLVDAMEQLLAGVVADPSRRISRLPLLAPRERQRVLVEWAGGREAAGPATALQPTLHALVERGLERRPRQVVVHGDGSQLRGAELESQANRLAHRLQEAGVGPETPVAVLMARTPDLVAALLAVLKAGGAYVPLDPSYPPTRLSFLLADSTAPVLVTDEANEALAATLAPAASDLRTLIWQREMERQGRQDRPPCGAVGDNLAYLIYTSGSTGRPKGVAIRHRSAVALLGWARSCFSDAELAGVLAATSASFDLSVFELFAPLAWGGCVVLAGDVLSLVDHPARQRVTLINTVPSALRELLRLGSLPPSAGTVNLAGEPLRRALADRVHETDVGRLLNLYGPSEDTTYSTVETVAAGSPQEPAIGRPLPGTWAYVLDHHLQPVLAGVVGELHLAGAGLSRGYFRRPGRTAERYLPDPFTPDGSGGRLYRTGDLVRHFPDGRLEFLGRLDHQVKIRGFRIELGEIEAALWSHPSVGEAAVLAAHRRPEDDVELVAFVCARAGEPEPRGEELLGHLRQRLPAHAVPGRCLVLDALPLTANGKIDRRALTEMVAQTATAAEVRGPAAPSGPVETLVTTIWRHVLGVPVSNVTDDFFALGGHSLSAVRVVARIRDVFGVELSPKEMFRARTVAAQAHLIEEARRRGEATAPEEAPRRQPEAPPTPSFSQERLWFLDRLEPGLALYNLPWAAHLRGRLDVAVLAAALSALVARHEVLRTGFEERAGSCVAHLDDAARPTLRHIDLTGLDSRGRDGEARRVSRLLAAVPFDLRRPPMLRTYLIRQRGDEHLFLVVFHHIAVDGWSLRIFARELSALYAARLAGRPAELSELPLQFSDYARWQRRVLGGSAVERKAAFWAGYLPPAPALDLPTDHDRPPRPRHRGGRCQATWSAAQAGPLDRLAQEHSATLFMLLLAGWASLLHRLTDNVDVRIGTASANRDRPDLEALLGFFVNTLVLRCELSDDPAFGELLERVRDSALDAFLHRDMPFEKVVELLAPERTSSATPLFRVMLQVEDMPPSQLDLPGLQGEAAETESPQVKFDLSLRVARHGEGYAATLRYATELFDATTAARHLAHLGTLLAAAAAEPARRLSSLPILDAAQRAQLTYEAELPAAPAAGSGIEEWVTHWARQTPRADAVLRGDEGEERWTYAALEEASNRLAHHLRRHGAGPERVVAVALEASCETVIGLLAVLKSGAAWLALHPGDPPARLEHLVADARPGWALVAGSRTPELAQDLRNRGVHVVDLDVAADALAAEPASAPPSRSTEQNLAYVLYTSGSTGQPKGVLVSRASLAGYLEWADRSLLADAGSIPALSHVTFDACLKQLLGPLRRGGSVWLPAADSVADPARLARVLGHRRRVTFNGVPTLWRAVLSVLDEGTAPPPSGLVAVLLGGEALDEELVRRSRARFPKLRLINLYGPTEATANAAWARLLPGEPVTLGRAAAGATLRVTDRTLRLRPLGVPGELCIGGPGLARGYLGRPALTAERFVPDPFAASRGARLYRSGDRVRCDGDGRPRFLGRIDRQVKLRGFRVEPGEIEAVLRAHPAVQEAAVIVHLPKAGGAPRLLAFASATTAASGELRSYLAARLPPYMVPAAVEIRSRLPHLSSGKTDRRALQESAETVALSRAEMPPRSLLEELLIELFEDVLEVLGLHRDSDFFAHGGHSLLATRLLARLGEATGTTASVRDLFEHPTPAGLAAGLQSGADRPASPELVRCPRDGGLPLSFAQRSLWFLQQLRPRDAAYNVALRLPLQGDLDAPALSRAVAALVQRHESLRTCFRATRGEPLQLILETDRRPLPTLDLSALADPERSAETLAAAEARRPFDLAAAPPRRWLLLRLAAERHWLLLTLHHILCDGWSLGVLYRELEILYAACRRGEATAAALPELPIQVADHAVWQRRWLSGETLQPLLAYWRRQLAGVAPLALPADRERPAAPAPRHASCPWRATGDVAIAVRGLARRAGATSFMVLLAAFQAFLHRLTGDAAPCVGSPVAHRPAVELEGLIGFFVNTLALRTDLSGGPSFLQAVERCRESVLAALGHQDLPFEKLVEELRPQRRADTNPLLQVAFALQTAAAPPLHLQGLRPAAAAATAGGVKFDLTFELRQDDGGLRGSLEYDAEIFDPTTVQRLARAFGTFLAAALRDPCLGIDELPLLRAAERHQALVEWNDPPGLPPQALPVHVQVESWGRDAPQLVAVRWREGEMTYGELCRGASALSRRLRRAGVGPGDLVALLLAPSPGVFVAQLAVLRCGAAYLPVDPEYPQERISFLLTDAAPRAVVSDLVPGGGPQIGVPVLTLDDSRVDATAATAACAASVDLEQRAYVIYTSGSTGRPKGVEVSHGSLLHLVAWHRRRYGTTPGQRTTQLAALAFDASVWETWPTLTAGATLCLPRRESRLDPADLAAWLQHQEIEVAFLPTPLAEAVLATAPLRESRLRWLLTGGDRLSGRPTEGLPFRLVNHYGPTECTVVVSAGTVEPAATPRTAAPDIGRPILGTRVYVVDRHLRCVAVGASGEIAIAGAGVSRGYLRRPALTAERFVPDPFSDRPGSRLYRSGDLARQSADGRLCFLGRGDQQVKVHGFRIELGEVESVLCELPGVAEAVADVRGDGEARRLVAWIVPRDGSRSAEEDFDEELRGFLRRRLPAHMVPTAVATIASLPLTAHGKVDRKALPTPSPPSRQGGEPRTPEEALLGRIWCRLLGLPRVGVEDNFFALGGTSLLVMRMVAEANETGLRATAGMVFESPTLADLAAAAEGGAIEAEQGPVVGGGEMTPIQHWFFGRRFAHPERWNVALWMRAEGVTGETLRRAVAHLTAHHDALRLRFPGAGAAMPTSDYAAPGEPPWSVVDLSALDAPAGEAREDLLSRVAEQVQGGFDLETGPLLRFCLLRTAGSGSRLLLVAHHLVLDGYSLSLVLADLRRTVRRLDAGEPAEMPAKSTSLRAWTRRLAEWARQPESCRQAESWLAQPWSRVRPLPVDGSGPNVRASTSSVVRLLGPEPGRRLGVESGHGGSLDLLLAALDHALAPWLGGSPWALNLVGHGREPLFPDVDLARTVGWLNCHYPLVLGCAAEGGEAASADDSPAALPERLRLASQRLRRLPHHGLGFAVLRYLGPSVLRHRLAALPEPQVSLNYLGGRTTDETPSTLLPTVPGNTGASFHPTAERPFLFGIFIATAGAQTTLRWLYSDRVHRRTTVETLADRFVAAVHGLAAADGRPS